MQSRTDLKTEITASRTVAILSVGHYNGLCVAAHRRNSFTREGTQAAKRKNAEPKALGNLVFPRAFRLPCCAIFSVGHTDLCSTWFFADFLV